MFGITFAVPLPDLLRPAMLDGATILGSMGVRRECWVSIAMVQLEWSRHA